METKTILAAVNNSPELGKLAVEGAIAFARVSGASRIHLVHVVEERPSIPPVVPLDVYEKAIIKAMDVWANRLSENVAPEGIELIPSVRRGKPAKQVVKAAEELGVDLIVVVTHDSSGVERSLFGSAANKIIRTAHCPVLVLREGQALPKSPKKVLAAVDLSEASGPVIDWAFDLAKRNGAKAQVLSCYEFPAVLVGVEDLLYRYMPDDTGESLRDHHKVALAALVKAHGLPGLEPETILGHERPESEIIRAAEDDADLLVLGTSGRNALHRMLLGATATRVIHHAPCPVLVVPHHAGA